MPRSLSSKVRAATPASGIDRGGQITNPLQNFIDETTKLVRSRGDANEMLRALAADDGMFSSAVYSIVQVANSGYKLIAFDADTGSVSEEGTQFAYQLIQRMDTLYDYTKGYNDKTPIPALIETLLREAALGGGVAQELVLDESLTPSRLVPFAYSSIKWKSDGRGGRFPSQKGSGGRDVDLNIPTVFVAESHKEADKSYAYSMFRSGLRQSLMYQEFLEDTRRGVRKTGHSRLVAKLIAEKVAAAAPPEYKNNPEKMQAFFSQAKASVEDALRGIEPEDAVVAFDSVEFSVEDIGGSKSDYAPLLKVLGNVSGSALKTPSSISGLRSDGSQSLSNAETLTYLKVAKSLCNPVEQVMSRALTLAVRLMGANVTVKFVMKGIDLRPETELEAFKSSRQNRVFNLLSLGMISDTYAMFELDLPPNPDSKKLSGTGFYESSKSSAEPSPDRKDAMGKDLNPGTPTKSGGRDQ